MKLDAFQRRGKRWSICDSSVFLLLLLLDCLFVTLPHPQVMTTTVINVIDVCVVIDILESGNITFSDFCVLFVDLKKGVGSWRVIRFKGGKLFDVVSGLAWSLTYWMMEYNICNQSRLSYFVHVGFYQNLISATSQKFCNYKSYQIIKTI